MTIFFIFLLIFIIFCFYLFLMLFKMKREEAARGTEGKVYKHYLTYYPGQGKKSPVSSLLRRPVIIAV